MSEEADEVKVFRNEPEDDFLDELDPHDASQLAEDKKDVVLEAELESRPLDSETPSAFTSLPPPQNNQIGQFSNFNPMVNMMMTQSLLMGQLSGYSPFAPTSPSLYSPFMAPARQRLVSPVYSLQAMQNPMQMQYVFGLNQMNQMQNAQMRGFGLPGPSFNNQHNSENMKREPNLPSKVKGPQEPKHKRPMNSYFFYKKELRMKLKDEDEFKNKQESELNSELAKRWNNLPQEEKDIYIKMAKAAAAEHKKKYPDWTAKENYGHNAKRKRKHNNEEREEGKKCRARFGTENKSQWCRNCTIKKKCMHARASEKSINLDQPKISSTGWVDTPTVNTPSPTSISNASSPQVFSPQIEGEPIDSEEEEESEEDDDPLLTTQAFLDMQHQEVQGRQL